jgi:hypothetical protein
MGGIHYVAENGELVSVSVSRESPAQRDVRGHFVSLTKKEQDYIINAIAESIGVDGQPVTWEQINTDLSYRILVNATQMRKWLTKYKRPTLMPEPSLFDI